MCFILYVLIIEIFFSLQIFSVKLLGRQVNMSTQLRSIPKGGKRTRQNTFLV